MAARHVRDVSAPRPDGVGVSLEHPHRVRRPEGVGGGLGGRLRVRPEDFRVEEVPLVRASGTGPYTLIEIEKRLTSTFDALLFVSKAAQVSERSIGYAGLKDSRAVTTQYLTVPKVPPERLRGVSTPRWRVLSAARHDVPLKIGHLKANRFVIRVRDVRDDAFDRARTTLERLVREGLPNAYGGQRFGTRLDGHRVGRALIHGDLDEMLALVVGRPSPLEHDTEVRAAREAFDRGDYEEAARRMPLRHRLEKRALSLRARGGSPEAWLESVGRGRRRIWVSAWQSFLFNRVLDARIADGTWNQVLPGDVAWIASEGCLVAARPGLASAGGRVSPTGPLPGFGLRRPEGAPGDLERTLLAAEGDEPEAWKRPFVRSRGLRRPLVVPVREASIERDGPGEVLVRFVLPPGSFATVLLDHLMA
ncbi:MAG: tRNA pseudouridine(13) synthase TruD [Planctomycetes bacterium]|nr:tRNA pseudouridine(13) synthase TruD [Planctomycetota bacterium]MCB9900188.1 tRNA pseudouridine(13) synthase TruD [Planctomycetota bacterium]